MDIQEGTDRASEVLHQLADAIGDVVARTEAGWRIASMADVGDGPLFVDTDGTVLQVLAESGAPGSDPAAAELVQTLISAYDYVLAAERAALEATERAERAERDAFIDHLTELPNRRAWDQALEREQARCDRNDSTVAVAVVDVDDLKLVNDQRGHLVGDVLLRQTALVLRDAFRGSDLVARTGGDEFAVLAVDFQDSEAGGLEDRVAAALQAAGVSASSGVAVHRAGQRLTEVWRRADHAMYTDKRARKG